MISKFFIDRPVFASVVSIIIVLAGLMALRILPIAQYPEIAPTTVRISASYSGASAETVEKSVTSIIEEASARRPYGHAACAHRNWRAGRERR